MDPCLFAAVGDDGKAKKSESKAVRVCLPNLLFDAIWRKLCI